MSTIKLKSILAISLVFISILLMFGYYYSHHVVTPYRDLLHADALLHNQEYAELHEKLEDLIEKNKKGQSFENEQVIQNYLLVLTHAHPAHEALFDEWVESQPGSAIPLLLRGAYYFNLAHEWRGQQYFHETLPQQKSLYSDYAAKASADLLRSIEINKHIPHTYRLLILLSASGHGPSENQVLHQAMKIFPASFFIRDAYMKRAEPKWGGSVELIRLFAMDTQQWVNENPKLASLTRYEHYYNANKYLIEKDYQNALSESAKALELGGNADYLYQKATILKAMDEHDAMFPVLDEQLAEFPLAITSMKELAYQYMRKNQFEDAKPLIEMASKLAPYRYDVELRYGWYLYKTQQYEECVQAYKRALKYVIGGGARAWKMIGDIYHTKLNNHEKSQYAYKMALNAQPESPDTWLDYGFLLSDMKSCDVMVASYTHLQLCKTEYVDESCTEQYFERDKAIMNALVKEGLCPSVEDYFSQGGNPLAIDKQIDL